LTTYHPGGYIKTGHAYIAFPGRGSKNLDAEPEKEQKVWLYAEALFIAIRLKRRRCEMGKKKIFVLSFILAVAAPIHQAMAYYKIIDLGTLGGRESWAWSINDNGQIVGWAYDISQSIRATLFDPTGGGKNINLRTLGGRYSVATSINDYGQIVGWSFDSSERYRAVLFDSTGRGWNINLGTLPVGVGSVATSINDCGQIVGSTIIMGTEPFPPFPPPVLSTLFDPTGGGKNIGLGTLGGTQSEASSINNYGQIVGWAFDSLGNQRATLFDQTGGGNNIDLNTIIDPSLGWTLTIAYSINNNGWIVGVERNPDGFGRAYLLIPEPASAVIMVLGATLIASKRRR